MRQRRVAATAALVLPLVTWSTSAGANAAAAATFIVNNAASAMCSDATTNSALTPYCTIQAAVNAATAPGDTVIIEPGVYAPFTVTASGTAAAPIAIKSLATNAEQINAGAAPLVEVTAPKTATTPVVTVNGAAYVNLDGLLVLQHSSLSGVAITGSSHITLGSSVVAQYSGNDPSVAISSGSSSVTLSRDVLTGNDPAGVVVLQGGSGTTITTDQINGAGRGPAVVLNGTANTSVTGNTITGFCGTGINVTGGSTSTSIQNNVAYNLVTTPVLQTCPTPDSAGVVLTVDGTSAPGTTVDYNILYTNRPTIPTIYSWAGTVYTSASALAAATGQATHDSNSSDPNAAIDSANSQAPGALPVDINGNPRVDDPAVPNTGAGTFTDYDRGATETVDPITVGLAATWPAVMPAATPGTFTATVTDSWGYAPTGCTYDFGDGSAPVTVTLVNGACIAQHAYSVTGAYTFTYTVHSSDGYDLVQRLAERVSPATAFQPALTLTATPGVLHGVTATGTATDDWSLASCTFTFGDGTQTSVTPPDPGEPCTAWHTYPGSGTYTVSVVETDAGGNQATTSGQFTS